MVPGHVLISPLRKVLRYSDLTDTEAFEFWLMAQKVVSFMESYYKKNCEICIQDGQAAGQTVDHLHIHILPKLLPGEIVPLDSGY